MTSVLHTFALREILIDEEGRPYCSCWKGPECGAVGKHPVEIGWTKAEGQTTGPRGGYGIPTGARNGILVVEGDIRGEIDGVENLMSMGPLPKTTVVESPSGSVHFYFKYPVDHIIRNSASLLGPGIDVRGEGGMVVGPGSPHKRGGEYKEVVDAEPASLPAWLLERLLVIEAARGAEVPEVPEFVLVDKEGPELEIAIARAQTYLNNALLCTEDGNSSARLVRTAAAIRARRIPVEKCVELLLGWDENNEPPWGAVEIRRALVSAERGNAVANAAREFKASNGLVDRLMQRVPLAKNTPKEPDPAHEYSFEVGARTAIEKSKIAYGDMLADLFDHKDWAGVLAYNTFSSRVVATNPPVRMDAETSSGLSDADVGSVRAWFDYHGKLCSTIDVRQALELVSRRRSFNPVQTYLRSLVWDGVKRLNGVMPTYFGTEDGAYERAVGPRWFISLVARALQPGCQSDCTLILEGAQGIGKTSAFRALMPKPNWYAESSAGVDSKDFLENLRGVWLFGFDELDSLTKGSLTKVNTLLTSISDHYRKSYGHYTDDYPRSCGFGGTTNSSQYLKDFSGGRRFWPMRVLRALLIKKIEDDRDQLWAEAVTRYDAGEAWHVDTKEVRDLCEAEQSDRLERDAWEGPIVAWLNDPARVSLIPVVETKTSDHKFGPTLYDASRGVTTAAVLEHAIGKLRGSWTNSDTQRVAGILKLIGWSDAKKVFFGGSMVRHYSKPS